MAVKKAEFARMLNVSKARISQYVQAGLPVLDDGRIDIDAGRAWIRANIDPAKRADWATGRMVERHSRTVAPAPSARSTTDLAAVQLVTSKVLTDLPSTVASAIADAGGSRGQAAHALRIVLEIIHDELVDLAERCGLPRDPRQPWRTEVMGHVQAGHSTVDWAQYFSRDGRSNCAGEIYPCAPGSESAVSPRKL